MVISVGTLKQDILALVLGAVLLSISMFGVLFSGPAQLFVIMIGLALMFVAIVDVTCIMYEWHPIAKLKSFASRKESGLAWIWIAGFALTIPFCAFVYWCLDYPFDIIVTSVLADVTLTGTMASAWAATQIIVSYLLAFTIIFAVLWVINNSKPGGANYY